MLSPIFLNSTSDFGLDYGFRSLKTQKRNRRKFDRQNFFDGSDSLNPENFFIYSEPSALFCLVKILALPL